MNDDRTGRILRAIRHQSGLRQVDVARAAGVDQKVVSLLELGRLANVSVRRFRRVCDALGVSVNLDLRWQGGMVDRLIDRGHAAIVELVLAELRALGWETIPEFTFNQFGDRGSVDILAWDPRLRALLIVEVKTTMTDLQAFLMSMSRKVRIVPGIVEAERGWGRRALGRILVATGTRANRTVIDRHTSMFDATFPARTVEARRWLRRPAGDFAGIWFVAPKRDIPVKPAGSGRVRVARAPGGDSGLTSEARHS